MVDNHTWFITCNKGLFKYDLETHQVSAASVCSKNAGTDDILKHDLLKGFCKDGKLWIASRNGLCTYDPASGKSESFSAKGISQEEFCIDAAEGPDNEVFCSARN